MKDNASKDTIEADRTAAKLQVQKLDPLIEGSKADSLTSPTGQKSTFVHVGQVFPGTSVQYYRTHR